MAKRTNKTDHVLNLLSSGKKNSEPEAEKEEQIAPPPVDPEPKQEAEPETSVPPAQEVSNVSVVHMSSNEENPIADSVRESLEDELNSYLQKKEGGEETPQESELDEEQDIPIEVPESSLPVNHEMNAEEVSEDRLVEEESKEPVSEPETIVQEAEDAAAQEITAEEETDSPESEPVEEDVDYEIVNVMEHLVRDKVVDYMRQFDNCTCLRCIEDTVALTLTHLPAKYVVVSKDAVSPLLNFYEKKYAGQIIVEITKACMRVDEFPHHQ